MHTAYCDRSGTIGFCSGSAPAGSLPIAHHENPALLRSAVAAVARHGYESNTLLVPGIPEAQNDSAAIDALDGFMRLVRARLDADLDQKPVNTATSIVPRDGDIAHRRGFKRTENPFVPGSGLHNLWDDDWRFRDNHVRGSALGPTPGHQPNGHSSERSGS